MERVLYLLLCIFSITFGLTTDELNTNGSTVGFIRSTRVILAYGSTLNSVPLHHVATYVLDGLGSVDISFGNSYIRDKHTRLMVSTGQHRENTYGNHIYRTGVEFEQLISTSRVVSITLDVGINSSRNYNIFIRLTSLLTEADSPRPNSMDKRVTSHTTQRLPKFPDLEKYPSAWSHHRWGDSRTTTTRSYSWSDYNIPPIIHYSLPPVMDYNNDDYPSSYYNSDNLNDPDTQYTGGSAAVGMGASIGAGIFITCIVVVLRVSRHRRRTVTVVRARPQQRVVTRRIVEVVRCGGRPAVPVQPPAYEDVTEQQADTNSSSTSGRNHGNSGVNTSASDGNGIGTVVSNSNPGSRALDPEAPPVEAPPTYSSLMHSGSRDVSAHITVGSDCEPDTSARLGAADTLPSQHAHVGGVSSVNISGPPPSYYPPSPVYSYDQV